MGTRLLQADAGLGSYLIALGRVFGWWRQFVNFLNSWISWLVWGSGRWFLGPEARVTWKYILALGIAAAAKAVRTRERYGFGCFWARKGWPGGARAGLAAVDGGEVSMNCRKKGLNVVESR